ncbi:NAD(P)-dependent alcohol dehydrogenase [Cyclobacterium roseum]|uniref:NAD(P)-dependent alcohol dehydrogenase n=1 Tax=Cyclobacterium roseum TaxID=2666137 RepID=UPI001F28EE66|nr:NAD(P)-dependent alcohol dehydrogenase [Cyclobacterium roseum]
MNNEKMEAILATGYGPASVLKLHQVSKPRPAPDEVLVKVITSSATTADAMMRSGKPWLARLFLGLCKPKNPIPGTGFAGYVAEIGSKVRRFQVGDRVFGETTLGFGTNAEYLTLKASGVLLPLPETLGFSEAATFCDGHLTAYNYLKRLGQVKLGDQVLINGASGSLGTAAVQIARHLGAEVTGVCSGKNAGLVKSLGASHVVDYTQEDFTRLDKQYDLIFDTLGKRSFAACKRILTKNGRYYSPVMKIPLLVQMLYTRYFSSRKAVFEATGMLSDEQLRSLLAEVLELQQAGKLRTVIDRQYPLVRLSEAHQYIDSGHKKGNLLIINSDDFTSFQSNSILKQQTT